MILNSKPAFTDNLARSMEEHLLCIIHKNFIKALLLKNLISIFSICFSEKPNKIVIQRVGDSADNIIASAGEDLEMECIATGGNPSPTLRWYADDQEIRSGHTQVLIFDCLIWGKVLLFSEKSIYGNLIVQFFQAKPYANIWALRKRKKPNRATFKTPYQILVWMLFCLSSGTIVF